MRRSLFGLCLVGLAALVVSSAMAAPPPTTGITASPSRVNFGRVLVGDTATQAVTFTKGIGIRVRVISVEIDIHLRRVGAIPSMGRYWIGRGFFGAVAFAAAAVICAVMGSAAADSIAPTTDEIKWRFN